MFIFGNGTNCAVAVKAKRSLVANLNAMISIGDIEVDLSIQYRLYKKAHQLVGAVRNAKLLITERLSSLIVVITCSENVCLRSCIFSSVRLERIAICSGPEVAGDVIPVEVCRLSKNDNFLELLAQAVSKKIKSRRWRRRLCHFRSRCRNLQGLTTLMEIFSYSLYCIVFEQIEINRTFM